MRKISLIPSLLLFLLRRNYLTRGGDESFRIEESSEPNLERAEIGRARDLIHLLHAAHEVGDPLVERDPVGSRVPLPFLGRET